MAYKEHPVTDFEALIAAGTQLVDVREPDEVAAGSLPGAVNIPLGSLPDRVGELNADSPVLLLCRSGGRSGTAAQYLSDQGFKDVTNLTGGMLAYAG